MSSDYSALVDGPIKALEEYIKTCTVWQFHYLSISLSSAWSIANLFRKIDGYHKREFYRRRIELADLWYAKYGPHEQGEREEDPFPLPPEK